MHCLSTPDRLSSPSSGRQVTPAPALLLDDMTGFSTIRHPPPTTAISPFRPTPRKQHTRPLVAPLTQSSLLIKEGGAMNTAKRAIPPMMRTTTRHWIPSAAVSAAVMVAMLCAPTSLSAQTSPAPAEDREEGRFYVGMTVPIENLGASFKKTVDNTAPNTLVPEPRRGKVFHDKDSANTFAYGIGLLAGYRLPLTASGLYISGEADIAFHGGEADGQLKGVGTSQGRNQLGESWPDRWSFEKDRSYGFTLKLGGSPGRLRSWGASLYALGGIRLVEAQFTNRFNGCMSPTPCSRGEFTSGTDIRERDFLAWTSGIGVEKMLGERLALRAETRYTHYESDRFTTVFDDLGVTVPSGVDAHEASALLSVAWYF